jgi:hypothetical protein
MAYRVVEDTEPPLSLKEKINPEHLLRAIENSLEHNRDSAHGVTGLTFERYTITVHKRAGLSWLVECKFKTRDTNPSFDSQRSRCRTRQRKQ